MEDDIITVKEIAELAGVSPSTVSFVLNGRPGIGKNTREKVTALLEEHGFSIKKPAEEESSPWGVVKFIRYSDSGDLAERNDDFITQVMEGIDLELRQSRYTMSVVYVDDSNLEEILAGLKYENTEGVIFLGTEFDAGQYQILKDLDIPVVSVDNCFRNCPLNAVDMDNIDGTQQAIEYLYQKGHRKIGYLRGTMRTGSLKERGRGVEAAMKTFGLELTQVISLPPRVAGADEEMMAYLEGKPELPTAFFADNDVIASGAMRALIRKGIRVPEDISIIGFDDSMIASVVIPSLTTMRVRKQEMGICAVRRLVDLMRTHERFITKTSVSVELIERETVSVPRTKESVWSKD